MDQTDAEFREADICTVKFVALEGPVKRNDEPTLWISTMGTEVQFVTSPDVLS